MTYWRMNLHPGKEEGKRSVQHAVSMLAAGYIGLYPCKEVGNLWEVEKKDLDRDDQPCVDFAKDMVEGDLVVVVAHNYPFALARVAGPYLYIPEELQRPEELQGVHPLFRHFRRVSVISYYADFRSNPHTWQEFKFPGTISRLLPGKPGIQYPLTEEWIRAISPESDTL